MLFSIPIVACLLNFIQIYYQNLNKALSVSGFLTLCQFANLPICQNKTPRQLVTRGKHYYDNKKIKVLNDMTALLAIASTQQLSADCH
jgi:hypothetical protein